MHKIDTKCIVSLFDLVKIEFYRVKQNSKNKSFRSRSDRRRYRNVIKKLKNE